ncbi:unnamed protein product, partial [marine sediment metagenome]
MGRKTAQAPKFLAVDDYLNEYAWRYNHRNGDQAMFEKLLLRAASREVAQAESEEARQAPGLHR